MVYGFNESIKKIKEEIPSITEEEIKILKKFYEQIEKFLREAKRKEYNADKGASALHNFKEEIKEILNEYNDKRNLLKYMAYYLINLGFPFTKMNSFKIKLFTEALISIYEVLLENKLVDPNESLENKKNFILYISTKEIRQISWDLTALAIKNGLNPIEQDEKGNTTLHAFFDNMKKRNFEDAKRNSYLELIESVIKSCIENGLDPLLENNSGDNIWNIFSKAIENLDEDSCIKELHDFFKELIIEKNPLALVGKTNYLNKINNLEKENSYLRTFLLDTLKRKYEVKNYSDLPIEEYPQQISELEKENISLRTRIKEMIMKNAILCPYCENIIKFITTGIITKRTFIFFREAFGFGNIINPEIRTDILTNNEYRLITHFEPPMESPEYSSKLNVYEIDLTPKIIYAFTLRFWRYIYTNEINAMNSTLQQEKLTMRAKAREKIK